MKIEVEVKDTIQHRWWLVAKFEYGIHAMEAARVFSEGDGRTYRVLDNRWPEEQREAILYKDGVAS